jgi:hypothetical protein
VPPKVSASVTEELMESACSSDVSTIFCFYSTKGRQGDEMIVTV